MGTYLPTLCVNFRAHSENDCGTAVRFELKLSRHDLIYTILKFDEWLKIQVQMIEPQIQKAQ